ncbi:MAG: hypothetical protein IPK13_11735 [Deltaproteobacteria bacterium]|nr:hypothetical protein [Deltaproteobacteria bacterium]
MKSQKLIASSAAHPINVRRSLYGQRVRQAITQPRPRAPTTTIQIA